MDEDLHRAIALLEQDAPDANPPVMVVLPPDAGEAIIGNRSGFIRLAIAALKAAQGTDQKFKKEPWVYQQDLDWTIDGLKFDASAHIYMPQKPSGWRRFRQKAFGLTVLLFLLGCFGIGFVTLVGWFFHNSK